MRYLLDTDFVIDHLTGQADALGTLTQLLPDGVAISMITFSEIYEGIYGSRDPRAAAGAFTRFLRGVPVLPVSRTVAKRTAKLRLELRNQGRTINYRALDLIIAATAIEYDLTLVTRNRKDYEDIAALQLY
jgi:predicted nucleic acid-binding protein